jgi:hypothetical protein
VRVISLGQHRQGGVIGMDALSGEDMAADRLDQRHQRRRRSADPVGEGRRVKIDAFPPIDAALAVEWQMQAVFGEQNVGEELRARTVNRRTPARGSSRRRGKYLYCRVNFLHFRAKAPAPAGVWRWAIGASISGIARSARSRQVMTSSILAGRQRQTEFRSDR